MFLSGSKPKSIMGKQPTNISTSVSIALSEKYEVLNTYKLLLFILMIVSTGFTFYSLSELNKVSNPYGGGTAGKQIADSLATVDLTQKVILRKRNTLAGEFKNGWYR